MLNETSNLVKDKVEDLSNTLQKGFDTIATEGGHKGLPFLNTRDFYNFFSTFAVDEATRALESAISSTEEAYTQLLNAVFSMIVHSALNSSVPVTRFYSS